jgi:hypothetical protein
LAAGGNAEQIPPIPPVEETKVTPLPKNDYAAAKDGVSKNAPKSKARF